MAYAPHHRWTSRVLAGLFVLLAGASLGCRGRGAEKAAAPRPNVLLLVVDTLRADHLGAYEPTVDFTPSLDAFAADALVFEDALAQGPDTINSSASLFTSTWVSEHGYTSHKRAISPRHVTLAEAMQRLGYDTFGVSTNPHVTRRSGMAQGFDDFLDILTWADTDAFMVDRLFFEWLEERRSDRPFFALLWHVDPHTPYRPPRSTIDEVVPPTSGTWWASAPGAPGSRR